MSDRKLCSSFVILLVVLGSIRTSAAEEAYAAERRALIAEIQADYRETGRMTGQAEMDPLVAQVLDKVPRHEFVPPTARDDAYRNQPLAIGHGQTISQPYIVAVMTDLLDINKESVVLEIGTGSGYQAAVLAELAKQVFTIEIIEELGNQATERLQGLGYTNIATKIADGYYGWPDHAPFDAIMVTAGIDHIPPPLVQQLKSGGKMLIPVGGSFLTQYLVLVEKDAKGDVTTRQLLPVRFVPLTGRR
jgi:protein-L-isoaspartate(D-aspartate) O-methyltransferase